MSGGEAHDCPLAERVVRRTKAAKLLLGDKAYDSAPLRQWLKERGTKAVVPNKANRKQPFSFNRKAYKQRHRIENAFCRLKDFASAVPVQVMVPPCALISLIASALYRRW